jgi:hypothetical protein
MNKIAIPLLFAAALLLTKSTALADTVSTDAVSVIQRIKVAGAATPSTKWPRAQAIDDGLLQKPLEQRLNQLVLDDNLRTLHMSVHSDFARNTPSFKRIESLVKIVANRDLPAKERWQAAQTLGEERHVYSVYAVPALLQSYNADPDITVRTYAALALVKIDLRSSIPHLILGLDSPNVDVRQVSASALHLAGARAVPALLKLVKCDDPYLKNLGCLALAEVGAPAKNAVTALRGASTELDGPGLFSVTAAESIDKIQKETQRLEVAGTEMIFDSEKWKSADGDIYRPAMVRYILSRNLLRGLKSAEVSQMLGRGISVDDGKQLRYLIGTLPEGFFLPEKKKHAHLTYSERAELIDSWLVLKLENDVVFDCRVRTREQLEGTIYAAEASAEQPPSRLFSQSVGADLIAAGSQKFRP